MAASIKIPTIFTANDRFSDVVKGMTKSSQKFYGSLQRISHRANNMSKGLAAGGLAIVGTFGVAINSASTFHDKMADVAKTTGLEGKGLEDLGNSILDMSKKTRSSIGDLQDIATIGGQLGISKDEILGFTAAANEFAVALGGDYSGGIESAVLSVGKLNTLFSDTENLKIDEHLKRAGSAFNHLSSEGKASVENINDFATRVGTLPSVLRPSFAATAGLGAFLEEVGLNSEIASSGFSTLILTAGNQLPKFAKQMNLTTQEASDLLSLDPVMFAQKFSRSFNGLKAEEVASKLKDLKIGSKETIKVVGALGAENNALAKSVEASAGAFDLATSSTKEYNVKNETTAARIAMAKNNMQALSITIGTQIVPVLNTLIDTLSPVIDKFSKWAESSPVLLRILASAGVIILGLAGVLKGISIVTNIAAISMGAYNAVMQWYSAAAVTAALSGASFAAVIWATVWPVLAVIAAIGAVIAIFYYWAEIKEWFSAKWAKFVQFISSTWAQIVSYFENASLSDVFMDIGKSIFEFLLFPLTSVLDLMSSLPGGLGDAAQKGLDNINGMLGDFNINNNEEETPGITDTNGAAFDSVSRSITEKNNNVNLTIKDKGNNVERVDNDGGIPIVMGNTLAY